ncbi:MAG TPA: zinc dependent phospholipase C family protein [Mucilaginibacter sp.]|nr:zinc dependent phospholipase C family protein [Mucilaginibacter sp.]
MPGPSTHILVSDEILKNLESFKNRWPYQFPGYSANNNSPGDLVRLAKDNPNYYAMGAVGPDLFYFLPDFRPKFGLPMVELIKIIEFLDDVYAKLDDWILSKWEHYFGPVSENLDEAMSRLTGDLSSVVADIMGSLSSILMQAVIDVAAERKDWFGIFSLGHNFGIDDKDFFWADMLHYRKTSTFANNLWKLAEDLANSGEEDAALWSDRLKAYALGYMSHVATDVTGHAFINTKAGGPYRCHWQRHHLVETHLDTKTYNIKHGMEAIYNQYTESAVHYRFAFNDDGGPGHARPNFDPGDNTLRGRYVRRRQLDLDSDIPEKLAQLLMDAMDVTYKTQAQKNDHGIKRTTPDIIPTDDGRPDLEAIQATYHLLFRYFKFSSLDGLAHEKPMPPDVFPNLDFPQLTDPLDDIPGASDDDDFDLLDLILSILSLLALIAEIAIWLATVLPGIVADLITYGPRLLAYYTIELPLYYMLKAERAILVMTGYLHPMDDEIDDGLITIGIDNHAKFIDLLASMDDVFGFVVDPTQPVYKVPDLEYPRTHPYDAAHNEFNEFNHPWAYPITPVEPCPTYSGPFKVGDDPNWLLNGTIKPNLELIKALSDAKTPFDTTKICFENVNPAQNMGDPVNFSSFLMWQLARKDGIPQEGHTEWNMDSDRGYAFKSWDWARNSKKINKDLEGHDYALPCSTLPQIIDGDNSGNPNPAYFNNKQPLDLVYLDDTMTNELDACSKETPCYNPKIRRPQPPR